MKKIIHMSDLHIGYEDLKDRFISFIEYLKAEMPEDPSQYIIVITGDVVNNAYENGSYEDARGGLDRLKQLGFEHVLVIPGNHDYGTGNKGNKEFVKLFKSAFYDTELDYPKIDIIDGITFIGLDSMAEEVHWYDKLWAQGQLGGDQLRKLEAALYQDEIRSCVKRVIYLHHHPFDWRPLHHLKDARELRKILAQAMDNGISIDALLFGHNHEGKEHNGKWGISRCYDAGTATMKPRPKFFRWVPGFKVNASTRVIDLSTDPIRDYKLS